MDVFVSWSGTPSREAAKLLKDLLENVMQNVQVWLSSSEESISSGELWVTKLKKALSEMNFGIAMVTKANMNAPYLLFEAGALSKTAEGRLVPVRCNLRVLDLKGPFSLLQSRGVTEDDFWRLVSAVNAASTTPLPEERLRKFFDKWWPDFNEKFYKINFDEQDAPTSPESPDERLSKIEDAVEELLRSTRQRDVVLQNLTETIMYLARSGGLVGGIAGVAAAEGPTGGVGHATIIGTHGAFARTAPTTPPNPSTTFEVTRKSAE